MIGVEGEKWKENEETEREPLRHLLMFEMSEMSDV